MNEPQRHKGIEEEKASAEAPPPVLGSWRNLYLLVLGALAAEILLLRLFTELFS